MNDDVRFQSNSTRQCARLQIGFWVVLLSSLLWLIVAPEVPEILRGSPMHKCSMVKEQMRQWQIAAMNYSRDHSGVFPSSAKDPTFRNYFSSVAGSQPGEPPTNPFSSRREWPVDGSIQSVLDARQQQDDAIPSGVVEYSAICDKSGHPLAFAIRGGDEKGRAILDIDGKVKVMSNQ